jgi:hypothetical protein
MGVVSAIVLNKSDDLNIGFEEPKLVYATDKEIIDKDKLNEEWNSVKYCLQYCKVNNDELGFIQIWKYILDTDQNFSFNYPNISCIIKIALILPLSNVHVERIFSEMKLIKNKLRNKMNINTLNNHLMILLRVEDLPITKSNMKNVHKKFL